MMTVRGERVHDMSILLNEYPKLYKEKLSTRGGGGGGKKAQKLVNILCCVRLTPGVINKNKNKILIYPQEKTET